MRKFIVIAMLLCLVVGILWWRAQLQTSPNTAEKAPLHSNTRASSTGSNSKTFASDSAREPSNDSNVIEDSPTLQLPVALADPAAQQRVDQLALVVRDYRLALSQNPVGDNAEISAALLGNNLKQIRFEIPEGSSLQNNQLCDHWGTPYFFHQISISIMEIRSAGPDQTMWTADDIIGR